MGQRKSATLAAAPVIASARSSLLRRVCERLLQAREDIRGIILFGSLAREEPHRDVDLLTVVGREKMGHSERDTALISLREALGPYAVGVDLVVVHEGGLRWGLEAHYPFYLNVALDGVVLYDADGITALLEQARREVEARNIRRTETGGWQFPVPYRQRVSLSPFDNVTWARSGGGVAGSRPFGFQKTRRVYEWLDDSERDLRAAEGLFRLGLYERSVTHSQQAVEKSVKAVLACMGRMEPSHYLSSLLRSLLSIVQETDWRERLETLSRAAAEMEPAAVDSRYPVEVEERVIWPMERYGGAEAGRALDLARDGLKIGWAFVCWWTEENGGGSGDA